VLRTGRRTAGERSGTGSALAPAGRNSGDGAAPVVDGVERPIRLQHDEVGVASRQESPHVSEAQGGSGNRAGCAYRRGQRNAQVTHCPTDSIGQSDRAAAIAPVSARRAVPSATRTRRPPKV